MDNEIKGFPQISARFLRGIPFEPPLAGIIPNIRNLFFYPLIAPKIVEIITAGTTNFTEFQK